MLDRSREARVFDESQELEDQGPLNTSATQKAQFNPLANNRQKSVRISNPEKLHEYKPTNLPQTPRQQQSEINTVEKEKTSTPTHSDQIKKYATVVGGGKSDFDTSLINDMNNISMVSFNMESTSSLGLGEMGQSIMNEGIDGINLMQIRETLHAREMKIRQLVNDKQKLKGLLVKAKAAISKINSQYKTSLDENRLTEQKLQHSNMEKQTMQKALEDMQKRRNGIEKS